MDASDRLERTVDDLIQIVGTAKSVPMSASAVINRADVLDLLHALRADVVEELEESRRLTAERDEVIAQARRDAEDHIAEARRERGSMLSGTEMGREAERIRKEALHEARRIREDADHYVDDKLANFEVVLTKTLQAVGRGRAKMGGRDPMDDLGQHVAEQDAVSAASRADYEYDERDHAPSSDYRDEYEQQRQDPYREQAPSPADVYQELDQGQDSGQSYGHDPYTLPEPDISRELVSADMSGIFPRPDFSQPEYAQQNLGYAPEPEYARADYGQSQYAQQEYGQSEYVQAAAAQLPAAQPAYDGYPDSNGYGGGYGEPQHQAYPLEPYGSAYQQQSDYQVGEYQAYPEEPQYAQQPPALPGQHLPQQPQHPAQGEATGFFDTGVIDVQQFRDDPYRR